MDNVKKRRLVRLAVFTFLGILAVFSIYLIYHFTGFGFKCPIYEITGFRCAGCGNTHALQSLLTFDIMESLSYNYIYPLEMFYVFLVYINSASNYVKNGKFTYKTYYQGLDITILVIVVLWIPLRNILGV